MSKNETISGLALFHIEQNNHHRILIGDDQHLLRRFGQLELLTLNPEQHSEFRKRQIADEIIFIDQGQVNIRTVDLRLDSPSMGVKMSNDINENSLEAMLVPFGVAYSITTTNGAKIIRLSTHNDKDDEAQIITNEHLDNILQS